MFRFSMRSKQWKSKSRKLVLSVASLTLLSINMRKKFTDKIFHLVLDESYNHLEAGQSKDELLSRARNAIASLRNKHQEVSVLAAFVSCSQPKNGQMTRAAGELTMMHLSLEAAGAECPRSA